MPMENSQILKTVDFAKTQKSRCLENKILISFLKKFINYTTWVTLWQKKSFLAEVIFKLASF